MADPVQNAPIPFCDAFNLRASPWGLVMIFGNQGDPGPDGQAAIRVFSQVGFSLAHAKTVVYIMAENIRQMEAATGEHTMPPPDVLGRLKTSADSWKRFWGDAESTKPIGLGALANNMNGNRKERRRVAKAQQVANGS